MKKYLGGNHIVNKEVAAAYHESSHLAEEVDKRVMKFIKVKGNKLHIRRQILGHLILQ